MMRKIVLTFPNVSAKEDIHSYLADKMSFPGYYGKNLDALYDCLTDIFEPTAVGIFLPVLDNDELDIELLLYLEKVKRVFLRAERDNGEYLAVFSDEDFWGEEGTEEDDPDEELTGSFASYQTDPLDQRK